jgi:hypothetical protein
VPLPIASLAIILQEASPISLRVRNFAEAELKREKNNPIERRACLIESPVSNVVLHSDAKYPCSRMKLSIISSME